jgi:7-cyano-7-deazaguanine tRNA-ribosyltransferase
MSFEIKERDLLGRIGRLETKSGVIETPLLLPVINPTIQSISPKTIENAFDCKALITNAYIIKKHFQDKAAQKGIHNFLDFTGVIMTDSGAYQILEYGEVEITSRKIALYQEKINTDIATILDTPTGWTTSRNHAQHTVKETLKVAKELTRIKSRDDIVWVGPVQGGQHLDLVARSAREIGKLPFQVHALGSPTPVMEQYMFDILVDMILTAKMNLPLERPLHLFGAGHPFMFALAVALGCDLFDSAAYAIYAREDRYMTEYGTTRLNQLDYFTCPCLACTKNNPQDVLDMPETEKQKILAQHNLYVSFSEIRRIKQAIIEGRLWEHLEMRAHGHPSLLQALKRLRKYSEYLEKHSPITKKSGLFFFGPLGQFRPEVIRHRKRLLERYSPPKEGKILVLLPQTPMRPFHKSKQHQKILKEFEQKFGGKMRNIHVCTYAAPFGVIPTELDGVYPLSQYEIVTPFDLETMNYISQQIVKYIMTTNYERVVLFWDTSLWKRNIVMACKRACKNKNIPLVILKLRMPLNKKALEDLATSMEHYNLRALI